MRALVMALVGWALTVMPACAAPIDGSFASGNGFTSSALPSSYSRRPFSDGLSEVQMHTFFQDILPATVAAPSQTLKTRAPPLPLAPPLSLSLHTRAKSDETTPLLTKFKSKPTADSPSLLAKLKSLFTSSDSSSLLAKLKTPFASSSSSSAPNPTSLAGRIAATNTAFQSAWDTHASAIPEALRDTPVTLRELLRLLRTHPRMLVPLDASMPEDDAVRSLYLRWLRNGLRVGSVNVL